MSLSKSKILRIILCLEILLLATTCGGERLCGPRLTEMLQDLCKNRYASLRSNNIEKRADNGEDDAYINDEPPVYNSLFAYRPSPFLASMGGSTALGPHVRQAYWNVKRGIIDDCCRKSCSITDLMKYCAI